MRHKNKLGQKENTLPELLGPSLSFDEAVELFVKEQLILNRTHRTIHLSCN
ncbi:MAG: hypothetical protein WBK64_04550 [Dethiobacteria bacterium]